MHSCEYFRIGKTTSDQNIQINNVINVPVEKAKITWVNGLTR